MSRIQTTFLNLARTNSKAFIPFITAGDAGLETTLKLMHIVVENGANIIELGVPFSDPMADGIVIQKSHERAVTDGVNLIMVLELVKQFRKTDNNTAVILMGYLNPIEAMGYKHFAQNAKNSGVDGVLIVDMPPEESHQLHQELDTNGLDLIFLIAPTTSEIRLAMINKIATGFVYFVSLKGVTGAGHINVNLVQEQLSHIKKFINLPIAVGFGINDASTAAKLAKVSDGIVVGSAIVKLIEQYQHQKDEIYDKVASLVKSIANAIRGKK